MWTASPIEIRDRPELIFINSAETETEAEFTTSYSAETEAETENQ